MGEHDDIDHDGLVDLDEPNATLYIIPGSTQTSRMQMHRTPTQH